MLPPYKKPSHATPSLLLVSTQRAIAGRVAPIINVGGNRQIAQKSARTKMPAGPWIAILKYNPPTYGSSQSTNNPQIAMPASSFAYARSGCSERLMYFENIKLPRHMPPMNVPSNTPIDTADEPTMRLSS